jgi:c-src tyrosine kinase
MIFYLFMTWPDFNIFSLSQHIEKGYRMEAPESCPPEIYEMIRAAWEPVPENRPNFSELLIRLESLKNGYV